YDYDQRKQHERFLPLLDAGTQPLNVITDQCHRRGMKFIAGFRINDGHAYQAREQGLDIAEFIATHPELQLRDFPEGEHYTRTEPLDFSFEEVRQFTLGVVKEVASEFNIDGVELCFRDCGYFPYTVARERTGLMTELVQNIRSNLKERGRKSGKKLVVGARVHATIEECNSLGLDIERWIRDGLLDYVSPQDTMYADFNLPYEKWSSLTRETSCMLYPGMLPWTSIRARYRNKRIPLSHATSRALAHTMYGAGADGISIYNHFVPSLWTPPFYPQRMQTFQQLRDPGRIAQGERHYIFDPTWAGQEGFGSPGKCSSGVVKVNQVTLDRSKPGPSGDFCFHLHENLDRSHGATLIFRGTGLTKQDRLNVSLNGHLIPDADIRRTTESDTSMPTDGEYIREDGTRKIPCVPEQGWFDGRPDPTPVFSTRWFSLSATHVVDGLNQLEISLQKSDPAARGPIIVLDEVEVFIEPS
ncbi:MAG: hypothetical protein VX910_08380, partial [Candidatus Latescibacterota bacterium]|nr:hypothetical protein [Candidatus Latescibacterota bacterium]